MKFTTASRMAEDHDVVLVGYRAGRFLRKEGNVRVASFYGLVEAASTEPLTGPMTIDSWLSAADGDASGFWLQSLMAGLVFPSSFVWGEYAATARHDAQAASDYFSSGGRCSALSRSARPSDWASTWPG